jgi:hypothetical protein
MKAILAAALAVLLSAVAQAETTSFTADLSGNAVSSKTGSNATGHAQIALDTTRKTVSMTLEVTGITLDGLWDQLVAAPIGPIHFHLYPSPDQTKSDGVVLVFAAPYGPSYKATPKGFRVTITNTPYADGAKLLDSALTFEAFKSSLEGGDVVLNIHTDAFHDGEISGVVVPAEAH